LVGGRVVWHDRAATGDVMHPRQRHVRVALQLVEDGHHPLEPLADDERSARRLGEVVAEIGRDARKRFAMSGTKALDDRELCG